MFVGYQTVDPFGAVTVAFNPALSATDFAVISAASGRITMLTGITVI